MKRPTIPDLAQAAGVSVSTVNRVISGAGTVRQGTRERVLAAARRIGFYGLGAIEDKVSNTRTSHRLSILLHQQSRHFYRDFGNALKRAATNYPEGSVTLVIEHLEDLAPAYVAERLTSLAGESDSVALVGAQHPLIIDAIDTVLRSGVPVTGLIAPLSANGNVSYVGLDNWQVGRTAGWAFDKMVRTPGEIGILLGSHRYRNQDLNESGFRSYFREHNPAFTLLQPVSSYESAAVAEERVLELFDTHPDMCGLLISGGGITGALQAIRNSNHRDDFVSVGYELFDTTRAGLLDGTLTLAIAHPIDEFAKASIEVMINAREHGAAFGAQQITLGFDIYTSENIGRQPSSHPSEKHVSG